MPRLILLLLALCSLAAFSEPRRVVVRVPRHPSVRAYAHRPAVRVHAARPNRVILRRYRTNRAWV